MAAEASRRQLVAILQHAFSGEKAAGLRVPGPLEPATDPEERTRIRKIEDEEWEHRRLVGAMIDSLGGRTVPVREARAALIGRVLGLLCHVCPWFLPMYGAGWLESHNIVEYENAARCARDCGREDLVDCLLTMAAVEWEHEAYFRTRVLGHPTSRLAHVGPATSEGVDPGQAAGHPRR